MAAITPEHYYLLALCFTCAYVLPFLIFLGRFDQSDPKIKALHRMLLGVMGWSLFDLIITHMAQKHSPETALTAFRWLGFLFLLYPPASFELILALLERDSRGMRLLVYAPYAGLYLWGLLAPGQVGGSTFGISNPLPQANEIWNESFRLYSLVASVFFLSWLLAGAWRPSARATGPRSPRRSCSLTNLLARSRNSEIASARPSDASWAAFETAAESRSARRSFPRRGSNSVARSFPA